MVTAENVVDTKKGTLSETQASLASPVGEGGPKSSECPEVGAVTAEGC